VNISRGGAAIFLGRHFDFNNPPDDVLHIRIHSPLLKSPLFIMGKICSRSQVEDGSLYRVKFLDFLDLLSKLPVELRKIFNSRAMPRFETGPAKAVNVNLTLSRFRIPAVLKDLTPIGMSVIIRKQMGDLPYIAKHVEASFRLPDMTCAFDLGGTVIHSRPCAAGLCWGIRFDGNSSNFQKKQDHLLQFISRRSDPRWGPK
jgi:hypothetical protein